MNSLQHYGVLGMKWGIRHYQNKDGSLTLEGKKRLGRLGHDSIKKSRTANFDKWGKSPETNTLYIAGYSGSGKSTAARSVAYPGDQIIHLDLYSDEVSAGAGIRCKAFEEHLDKTVPNWREISKEEGGKFKRFSKEYWNVVDDFSKEIEKFSANQYKEGHRVIVEGIQVADGWLHGSSEFYADKPTVVLGTNKVKSLIQAFDRDERSDVGLAVKSLFAKDGTNWSNTMTKNLNDLVEWTNAKKGSKAVDEYLSKYGQRRAS